MTANEHTTSQGQLHGSDCPGIQRECIVPPEIQAPYDTLIGHILDCDGCSALRHCDTGTRLRQAAREARVTEHTSNEHGRADDSVTRLFHGPPITEDDLPTPSLEPGTAVCEPCLLAAIFELNGPHACAGTTTAQAVGRVLFPSVPRPCPCAACQDDPKP
ncbi:hypothetical protein [Streptomyces scopuliridis]|uniref:hypothetical protein n=1 Tax=Streptomyces scopuliridis TaxID=452529 RepID=UPI0035E13F8E